MLGNFIADAIKGKTINNYSSPVKAGIKLHREIDNFTDSNEIVRLSKNRLNRKYRKYSGVIVDMYYDHFLAANWKDFSSEELVIYSNKKYDILLKYYSILPSKTKRILPFMIIYNWLASYAKLERLQKSFEGMAKRTPFESHMEHAVEDLKKDYKLYEAEFKEFMPMIIKYVHSAIYANS